MLLEVMDIVAVGAGVGVWVLVFMKLRSRSEEKQKQLRLAYPLYAELLEKHRSRPTIN